MSGVLGLILAVLLIAANGLFVASEFALVSVRRPAVDEQAAAGGRRAGMVQAELGDLSYALSTAQFGITATSLIFGFIADTAVGETLVRPVVEFVGLPPQASLSVTLAIAFFLSTVSQMLFGELFPKNLAISRPLEVARAVTPFTRTFGVVCRPVIWLFDQSARFITERVLGVEMTNELASGHDLSELARIIAISGEEGSLSDGQFQLLQRAVTLGDRAVADVMVRRRDVVWLTGDDTLSNVRLISRSTGHSRFPVHGTSEDDVLGEVHVKDVLSVPLAEHGSTLVTHVTRDPLVVPESAGLRTLVTAMRRGRRTFAVVVDEFGGTAGIVTLEDVLEELVGDIEDEFDRAVRPITRVGSDRVLVDASMRPDEVADALGIALPTGDYGTLAGLVIDDLGRIPEPGDSVACDEVSITVSSMDGMRVELVTIEGPALTVARQERTW